MANGEEIEEDEASGGTKHTRSLQLRLIEELTSLYKACERNKKELTDAQRNASTLIFGALSELGVTLTDLSIK